MKSFLFSIAAAFLPMAAFCQEPTTVKEQNLKGNVLSMSYSKYEYLENFGTPTEGHVYEQSATFFDELGRSVLFRKGTDRASYVMDYSKEDSNTKVFVIKIPSSKEVSPEIFEKYYTLANSDLENFYLGEERTENWGRQWREITYNNDNVIVKYDFIQCSFGKEKLEARRIAKPLESGVYAVKIYNHHGDIAWDFKETYKKGLLTYVDNPKELMQISAGDVAISPRHAGYYEYNSKGQVISYQQQKNSSADISKYYYNDKGDLIKVSRGRNNGKPFSDVEFYENYKYDEQGNWTYRTMGFSKDKPKYIEKRQISYCNSTEELKEKAHFMDGFVNMKSERDFGNFFNKYLTNGDLNSIDFVASVPLSEYDKTLASVPEASKLMVELKVNFKTYWEGYISVYFNVEELSKLNKKQRQLVQKYTDIGKDTKYDYKDGLILMDNEQYKIDQTTGVLTNITRGITFKKK